MDFARNAHSLSLKTREDFVDLIVSDRVFEDLGQEGSVVDLHIHSARAGEHGLLGKAGPRAVDLPAVDSVSHGQQRVSAAVVGAGRSVLVQAAAEFGHHHGCDAIAVMFHVRVKSRQAQRERFDQSRLNPAGGSLEEVGVPVSKIDAGRLEPDLRFDQSRDLAQARSKLVGRVIGARFRSIRGGAHRFDALQEIERLAALAAENADLGGINGCQCV